MEPITKIKPRAKNCNKPAYVIFVMTAIIFMFLKDFSHAMMFSGLALVFDPFDTTVSFNKRPTIQKLWLIGHIFITFALFALMMIFK